MKTKNSLFLVVLIFAVATAVFFVFIGTKRDFVHTQKRSDLLTLDNQFPLIRSENNVVQFDCLVSSKKQQSSNVIENVSVSFIIVCDLLNHEGKAIQVAIPLVLVNNAESKTVFIGKGIFNSANFTELAINNAYKDISWGTKLVVEFDPTLAYYKKGTPSIYQFTGHWLEVNQSQVNMQRFIDSGDVSSSPTINGLPILVAFNITIKNN